jgi:DNA-binding CsgD family transcriptional regulator
MRCDGDNADPNRPLTQPDDDSEPLGELPHGEGAYSAALVFDAAARLLHVSEAFAKLVGMDPGSLVGSTPPFPWCRSGESDACRDRVRLLAGSEARKLGIESLSWRLYHHCGACLRERYGAEKVEGAFKRELYAAMCFAVCDAGMADRIRGVFSSENSITRRDLEGALRRIALEVERLGFSLMLPAQPEASEYEDLRLLSPREFEVLRPFMEGRRVASIARMLSISPHTVRGHLQSIYGKLGVRSQEELIEKLRRELGDPRLSEERSSGRLVS